MNSFLNGRVVALTGNIAHEKTDAIVNAANSTLLGGGGVDGAIHDAGGAAILDACREIRRTQYPQGLPTGEAVITTAGNLQARFVIHTVGPIKGIDRANEAEQLANCYRNSLQLAVENGLTTVAFPSISMGAYGYPKHEAAEIASRAIKNFLENDDKLTGVRLVFFAQSDLDKFVRHQVFE